MSKKRSRYHYYQYSKIYFMVVIIATILLYAIYNSDENDSNFVKKGQLTSVIKQELTYLLNTSTCKIPESNPYSEDIVSFLKEEKYFRCSSKDLLTYISKNDGIVTLNVNRSLLNEYSFFKINCCYSNITRVDYQKLDDNKIKLTDCNYFEDSVELEFPYVRVICSTLFTIVYDNVHATTLPLPLEKEKRTASTNSEFSVLLLGIDSMSKANLKRTMPETYRYAEKNMINLKGYNKIGDNTFPNLMAILTGYSVDQLAKSCNRTIKMNYCNFIWDSFKEDRYITAFAEDECIISTYHFDRPGFLNEPTDFYYHPYFLAAEQLSVIKRKDMTYCAGPETSGERILNAAKDFSVTFNDSLTFGLFWSNSFSHDDVNMAAVMDKPVYKLLSDPEFLTSLNHTILLFFSDHGFRFGDIRYTHTGWLEERLPFMYLRLPDYFKYAFPEKYNNLLINSDRLTTPWDVFNTFQDILKLQNDSYSIFSSPGCPTCQSLFTEIAENRTCEDANIQYHWCTCNGHSYINPEHPKVKSICHFVVSEINRYIQSFEDGALCIKYTLKRIRTSGVSESYVNSKNETFRNYLVMVETVPPAIFEATVEEVLDDYSLKLLAEPSRVDRYEPVTKCIKNNGALKKFCYCDSIPARIKKIFS